MRRHTHYAAPTPHHARAGFTLVELIVVIAIFAVVGGVAVGFFVSTITGRAKAQARIETQENARFALDRITYEIRRARGIEGTSDFGVNLAATPSASLDLDMTTGANDPTTFTVSGGVLYLKQGAASAVALTSDSVSVTDFTLQNESTANGRSKNIALTLTVHHDDPTGTASLSINHTLRTTVELRGK